MVSLAEGGHAIEGLRAFGQFVQPRFPFPRRGHLIHLSPCRLLSMRFVRFCAVNHRLGHGSFKRDNSFGFILIIFTPYQLEEISNSLLKLSSMPLHFSAVFCVVRCIRKTDITLTQEESILRVVVGVGVDVPGEQDVHVPLVQLYNHVQQGILVLHLLDQIQPWGQRFAALCIDLLGVHAGTVILARDTLIRLKQLDHFILDVELSTIP
mmetsp:Transcript_28008/g.63342  ORF Transcript_28008/g.63342 Transcript_28008/m.63342 type:complete len:209 (+) Transcript_28008:1312-1938(+)